MESQLDPLSKQAFNLILKSAQDGWSPKDLLHILGHQAHGIIYRTAVSIPARISSMQLRKAWIHFEPPARLRVRRQVLHKSINFLSGLPPLKDAEILIDVHTQNPADGSAEDPSGRVHTKIQRLLEKAESTTFEHEARALVERAQLLQQRYRLDNLFLEGHGHTGRPQIRSLRLHLHPPYIKHQLSLLGVVAEANGCACVLVHPAGVVCVLGQAADVKYTEQLFLSLNRQCDWFMRQGQGAKMAKSNNQSASYRRSFRLSYAGRIAQLLATANAAELEADQTGNQYGTYAQRARRTPLLQERLELSEQTRNRLFPHLSSVTLTIGNWLGANDGVSAAEHAHFRGDGAGLSARRELSR